MENRTAINVTCAIIRSQNKFLVARRSEKMSLPLKWEFPGGKINGKETSEECIHREIFEELNIRIEIVKKLNVYSFDYGDIVVCLIPFIADLVDGEIILLEHKEYCWLKLDDLESLDWAAADVPIMNDLIKLYYV